MNEPAIQPDTLTTEEAIAHWKPSISAAIEREYATWPAETKPAPAPVDTGFRTPGRLSQ